MSDNQMHERVEHDFTLHPPESDTVAAAMDDLRFAFKALAHQIVAWTPQSREQSSAISRLEESCFHAIAALARNQGEPTT